MKQFIIISLLCFAAAGCQRSDAPGDLPKLFPCAVTITQDGKPLEGAVVEFVSSEDAAKYHAVGLTDAAGVAEMKTYGKDGAPEGKYKVVVRKHIHDDLVYGTNSAGEKEVSGYTTYRTIDDQFADAKTTPHEIEITGKGKKVKQTFDVGKAIKKRL
jgi:hypothetical protein